MPMSDRLCSAATTLGALLGASVAAVVASGSSADAWALNTLHAFCAEANCTDGSQPLAGVIMDPAGNLFGTAQFGGSNNRGVVFELKRKNGGWNYKVLYSFCAEAGCSDGSLPSAALILDTGGSLYGTTETGGAFNCGTVFKLAARARGTWHISTLHDFCSAAGDGKFPIAGLTYQGASSGTPYDGASPLYSTTSRGGAQDQGTVYALARHGKRWRDTVLHSFCARAGCADGQAPLGDLILDNPGNLYGNTSLGGSMESGVVFELSPTDRKNRWQETVLYDFCQRSACADGARPLGALLMDGTGTLFGTTADPGDEGVVYKLVPDGKNSQETVLHSFSSPMNGYTPLAGLIMDGAGTLFGTTAFGGTSGATAGTVFTLSGTKHTEHTVLYNFCSQADCADGAFPEAPVIMDARGHLYGTTSGGVGNTRGTVFELSP